MTGIRCLDLGTHHSVRNSFRPEFGIRRWVSDNDRRAIDILYLESGIRNRVTGIHRWAIGIPCRDLGIRHWATNSFRQLTGTLPLEIDKYRLHKLTIDRARLDSKKR